MTDRAATARRREEILRRLQTGRLWRAEDLARALGVSVRTIYRDLDLMGRAGLPVAGARGMGYVATAEVALPPMNLSVLEMEALQAALAGLAAADGPLAVAARDLASRIAAETGRPDLAAQPLTAAAGALPHLAALRRAVAARQKVRVGEAVLRPLRLAWWGGLWRLVAWDESAGSFAEIVLHRAADVQVLPELFTDETGRTLEDYLAAD